MVLTGKRNTVHKIYSYHKPTNMTPYSVLFITQESTQASCKDALTLGQTTSGVYIINPDHQPAFQAYCDRHGHWWWWVDSVPAQRGWISQLLLLLGWLSERVWNFYCYWADYQKGFGNPSREFWLGLERIHHLTSTATQLRIDMQDFEGNSQ